jgi:hypothetical protein
MATVTPRAPSRNLEQARTRIRSPLDRLRKYIASYISAEGAAVFGLFVALWFWIGMLLDYGCFKLLTVDWVQELPWWFRFGILVVLTSALLALVAVKVLTGLLKRFSDAAVALVLERRFPRQLGDRLITAVELSDPEEAARLGYSADLVRQTIHEAAERVDQVPVKEVFDWRRLVYQGILVVMLTLGLYLLAGAGFAAVRVLGDEGTTAQGFGDLNEVSSIWFERNVLLRNTIWPRRAYLEIVDFPDDLRIAKDTSPPTLRVRAWKYVLAEPSAPEGWRLLTWQDLQDRDDLLGGDVPELPADWKSRDGEAMTVDEVELQLNRFEVRQQVEGKTLSAKWNIASAAEESGYRPLEWSDLTRERLGGLSVPALPGDWDPKAWPVAVASGAGLFKSAGPLGAASRVMIGPKYITLSVDQVEAQLARAEQVLARAPKAVREKKQKEIADIRAVFIRLTRLVELREALDRVDARAAERAMNRTLRKLIVPETVLLTFKSRSSTSQNMLQRVADNEYTGNFGELKETVSFTVRGEDYITPRRTITVVELPRLEKLDSEEKRPAYLYYRPEEGKGKQLRGKLQPFEPIAQSVSGDTTSMDVPAGTHLSLTATTNKPLRWVKVVPMSKADARTLRVSQPELIDEKSFVCALKDVRREQRFTFEFTDTDGVIGRRNMVIAPRRDSPPRVREFNPDDVIRRGKEGYLVAVGARIPFKAKLRDDNGLGRVRYACSVVPADFISEQKVRALDMVAAVPLLAPGTGTRLAGVGAMMRVFQYMAQAPEEERPEEQLLEVPAFQQAVEQHRLQDGRRERLDAEVMQMLLGQKQRDPFRRLLNEFSLEPDRWTEADPDPTNPPSGWVKARDTRSPIGSDLPLWLLTYKGKKLKDPDETKTQKRYVIEVRLLVEDTYTEGELDKDGQPRPNVTPSGETFTFVIVPENELLSRISEEEDLRYRELDNAFKPLAANQDRLSEISLQLSAGGLTPTELGGMVARTDSLDEVLKASQQEVKAVSAAYERIVREMRLNQVREDMQRRVYTTIARPLSQAADTNFERTRSAVLALRKALGTTAGAEARITAAREPAKRARDEMRALVRKLNDVLTAMQGLAKINDLINALAEIERKASDIERVIQLIHKKRLKELLDDPEDKDKKKD